MEVGYLDFRGGVKECGMVKITEYSFGDYSVAFACEGHSPFGEMSRLHICNLGMHFCASAQVPEFNMYDFEMAIRSGSDASPMKVKCTGVVVRSAPQEDGFYTVIHFSNLCQKDAACLKELTKLNKTRCEVCANC